MGGKRIVDFARTIEASSAAKRSRQAFPPFYGREKTCIENPIQAMVAFNISPSGLN
jgi:hypothetical protein